MNIISVLTNCLFTDKRLWILLALLIVLRLPFLNRPVSKHHEFNTAVILINAESWQQAGGGKQFCYTPLMNYQGNSNRVLEKGWHIDSKGNHVYLSFGAGWYVLPYAVFKLMHIPFTPLSLQVLSIFIGFITAVLLYALLFKVVGRKDIALAGSASFVLLPAPLWYCGTAYVSTAIMLPLVIPILLLWHAFEESVLNINVRSCFSLFVLGIMLCYFEWLAVFLLGVLALWALVSAKRDRRYLWISAVATLTVMSGVLLVLVQFAAYLGWQQVLHYWQARFSDRSTDTSEYSAATLLLFVIKNIFTAYLPLVLLLFFVWKKNLLKKKPLNYKWPLWALAVIIPYNGIFFNWSAIHEFAWMAFGLFATIAISIYFLPSLPVITMKKLVAAAIVISIIQYFVINLPGATNVKRDRYDEQKRLGEWIRNNVDTTAAIFTNLDNDKIVEYYSKRTFNSAGSAAAAKTIANAYHTGSAVWLFIEKGKVKELIPIISP